MLLLSMTLQRLATVGWLALSAWAGAVPVVTENKATDTTQIVDKETGQKVYWKSQKAVIFLKGKRLAEINLPEEDGWFSSAILGKDALYLTIQEGKLSGNILFRKYSQTGKLLWQYESDYGPFGSFDRLYEKEGLISYSLSGPDAMSSVEHGLLNTNNGKKFKLQTDGAVVGIGNNRFIVSPNGPNFISQEIQDYLKESWKEDVIKVDYKIYSMKGREVKTNFLTPPRKNCGKYPMPDFYRDADDKKNEDLKMSAGAEVRGEYIYARRIDQCGKFTYKFHWTDPKNPAPQILQGWQ